MKYNKYEMGSYNLHTVKTDRFKSINIKINFKRPIVKNELVYRNLISDILFDSSKKYPTRRELIIKSEELYNLRFSSQVYKSGLYSVISFNIKFLNEKYTEEKMFEQSINFLIDLILNPNAKDDRFNEEALRINKKILYEEIEGIKDNPTNYAHVRLLEEMDKKAPYSYRSSGYLEDLENVDSKNLYKYYKSVIHSDLIDVFVVGDINESKVKKLFASKFNINTLKKPGKNHFIEHDKIRKTLKKKEEKFPSVQGNLLLGIKLYNLTEFEKKYVASIYNFILGGGPDSKLFKTVREKNSLCYSISSSLRIINNIIVVSAGIDNKKYKLALKLIKKEISDIAKGLFDDEYMDKAKITYINSCREMLDSPFDIINSYVSHEYMNADSLENRMQEVLKVTKEMVVNLAKKVHLDTVYFLEGGHNEEGNIQ